ncbi:hypothetical protein CPC08DRAFT_701826 [Agrocybe pediades]|nr:hypothetical protein CPC08DRAFT_701826 [Agrocybe pediades]
MELPSARELELETLLREKDAQLAERTDEIVFLRQYLAKQPGPSTTEPVTLPPAFVSVLLPHISNAASRSSSATSTSIAGVSGSSSTVTAALTQRIKLLQDENEELYGLLKQSETGKLKDEVQSLRRLVSKLERALKESHQAMQTISQELEKSNETVANTSRLLEAAANHKCNAQSNSYSPKASYKTKSRPHDTIASTEADNDSKSPLPTEPRAHKRPRLSESSQQPQKSSYKQPSPSPAPPRLAASLPQKPQTNHHHHHGTNSSHSNRHNGSSRMTDGRHSSSGNSKHHHSDWRSNNTYNSNTKVDVKMEVDEPTHTTSAERDVPSTRERSSNTGSNREYRERSSTAREKDRDSGVGGGGKERERPREHAGSGSGKDWNDRKSNGHTASSTRRTSHTNGHPTVAPMSIRGAASNPHLNSGRRVNDRGGTSGHHQNTSSSSDSRTLQERMGL